MIFFQATQKPLSLLGVSRDVPLKKKRLNWRSFCGLLIIAQSSILEFVFFLIEAEEMDGYVQSFYFSNTTFLYGFIFATIVWKQEKMFKLMDDLGNMVQKC